MIEERLVWDAESAPVREQLRIREQRAGGPPAVHDFERELLDRNPPYDETVDTVMRALNDLGTERQSGMITGPIPITAIWRYWQLKGYDAVGVEILTSAVLHGDRVILEQLRRKAAAS